MLKKRFLIGFITLSLIVVVFSGFVIAADVKLEHWPKAEAELLEKFIKKNRNAIQKQYVVYDADNTIWRYDLEESLLPYLEMKEILNRKNMDPSLKLIPFKKDESLSSYYLRLSKIDDKIGYPWIAQIFSGFKLGYGVKS
jgi:hypothetical protein